MSSKTNNFQKKKANKKKLFIAIAILLIVTIFAGVSV